MLDIGLTARPLFALVRASGTLNSAEEAANFSEALQFVPPDDDIVVDLSGLSDLSEPCAVGLRGQLRQRAEWSESATYEIQLHTGPCGPTNWVRGDR